MRDLVARLLAVVEAELLRSATCDAHMQAALAWRDQESGNGKGDFCPAIDPEPLHRWPVLSAWRWLIPMSSRESVYNADVEGHSANDVRQEYAMDLG